MLVCDGAHFVRRITCPNLSPTPTPSRSASSGSSATPSPTPSPTPTASPTATPLGCFVGVRAGVGGACAFVEGTPGQFVGPRGIAFDPASGTLFVADASGNRIRAVTSGGLVSTLAGNGGASFSDAAGASAPPRNWIWQDPADFHKAAQGLCPRELATGSVQPTDW